jgi:serine protease Do
MPRDPHHSKPKAPGYLGVYLDPNSRARGAALDGVERGSPAAKAGLREGDLVVAANGVRVTDTAAFVKVLQAHGAGDTLRLAIRRGRQALDLAVTLAPRKGAQAKPTPKPTPASPGWLGIAVEDRGGVVVSEVAEGGPAARAGVKPGDVLVAIDGKALTSVQVLAETISTRKAGQVIALDVNRNGWTKTLKIPLGKRP